MSDLAIDAQSLRKVFGKTIAVADFTLQVGRGEIFGFLGPNGAGKTTSVKMLLGLTKPTAGQARLFDAPLGDRQARARVGYLPEHFRFHEWLTATEFLDLHGRLYGLSGIQRRRVIPDLLALVGLSDQAKLKLAAFSKGMLQRIGLAQALLNDPQLVFLDEPTSGLDPMGRRLVRRIVNGLREEGTSVFLNSHLLSEIELTCDRVAFIRQGSILRVTSLAQLQQENVYVRLRVGEPTATLLAELNQFGSNAGLDPKSGIISMNLTDEQVLPRLASWLVQAGHALYELSPQQMSLEEHFMRIIGENVIDERGTE